MKKKGGGKAKGAGFEREICKDLSRWVSHGRREDLFWRSAMSGGRATLGARKGLDLAHQAGDISAVHPDGHVITNHWYVECKFLKRLKLGEFLINGTGPLRPFWAAAVREAKRHKREPMLVAKQNKWPTIVITKVGKLEYYAVPIVRSSGVRRVFDVTMWDELMATEFDQ